MALGTKEGHLTLPWGIWKSLGGDTQVRDGVVVGLAKKGSREGECSRQWEQHVQTPGGKRLE